MCCDHLVNYDIPVTGTSKRLIVRHYDYSFPNSVKLKRCVNDNRCIFSSRAETGSSAKITSGS